MHGVGVVEVIMGVNVGFIEHNGGSAGDIPSVDDDLGRDAGSRR